MTDAINDTFAQTTKHIANNVTLYSAIINERASSLVASMQKHVETATAQLPKIYSELQKARKRMLNAKNKFIEVSNNFHDERELYCTSSAEGSRPRYKTAKAERNSARGEYKNAYVS